MNCELPNVGGVPFGTYRGAEPLRVPPALEWCVWMRVSEPPKLDVGAGATASAPRNEPGMAMGADVVEADCGASVGVRGGTGDCPDVRKGATPRTGARDEDAGATRPSTPSAGDCERTPRSLALSLGWKPPMRCEVELKFEEDEDDAEVVCEW